MKIVHLLGDRRLPPDPELASASGVVRVALELARVQAERGHDVTVATTGTESWRTHWRGVKLSCLQSIGWARLHVAGRSVDFRSHLAYMLSCAVGHPDVVHAHNAYYLRFLRARRRIAHFHADPFYRGTQATRTDLSPADFDAIARDSDAQVAVSHFIAGEVRRGLGTRANLHVVHNGVEMERFTRPDLVTDAARLRAGWSIRPGETIFLYAGAIVPEKGVIHLARSFARLEAPGARLILAGGGGLWGGALNKRDVSGYETSVRDALGPALATGRAHALGNVPTAQMPAIYAAADVVVVPSVWREAFPMVALEAAASGRPVIASHTGGLPESVTNATGVLVPPGDENALFDALQALTGDGTRRRQMGLAARELAPGFSWPAAADQIDRIYRMPLPMQANNVATGEERSTA